MGFGDAFVYRIGNMMIQLTVIPIGKVKNRKCVEKRVLLLFLSDFTLKFLYNFVCSQRLNLQRVKLTGCAKF